MKAMTAFSWGYFGWGNHVDTLIETVDAVEKKRGWRPPVFVDVRIRRNVRAKGFHGDRFARTLGGDRYVWIRQLGNRSIVTGGNRTKIDDPNAALQLLALLAVAQKARRRVIFFCSCENPWDCHRHKVGTLLLTAAKRQGFELTMTEWPGGTPTKEPKHGQLELTHSAWAGILNGREAAPFPGLPTGHAQRLASLAWGSRVHVSCGDDKMWLVSGPAQFRQGRWALPILEWYKTPISTAKLLKQANVAREWLQYNPRRTATRAEVSRR